MDPEPLRDRLDVEAWEPPPPPVGFTERVMARLDVTSPRVRGVPAGRVQRGRWMRRSAAVLIPLAAAAAVAIVWRKPPSVGDVSADERRSFALGSRAVVVAEAGAHVAWRGDEVNQDRGDAFYRVEPGATFRVHTPAGDVEVRGTCFRVKVGAIPMNKRDMKSGAVGAVLGAMAFVGVYEGKVAVSRGAEKVEIGAGQAAHADEHGVHADADLDSAKRAFDARLAPDDDPLLRDNANLEASAKEYKRRLESIETERRRLEEQLDAANAKLGAASDAGPPSPNKAFDLSNEDWNDLAKEGTVKFRMPCSNEKGWTPSAPQRDALGLAPDDVEALREAYAQSYKRVWADIRPLCAEVLSPAVADKLGPTNCPNAIVSILTANDWKRLSTAMRDVAEIRAGLRAMPEHVDDPVMRVFLRWTGELGELEQDLAAQVGPDEAHRIVYSDSICAWNSTWPGSGSK